MVTDLTNAKVVQARLKLFAGTATGAGPKHNNSAARLRITWEHITNQKYFVRTTIPPMQGSAQGSISLESVIVPFLAIAKMVQLG